MPSSRAARANRSRSQGTSDSVMCSIQIVARSSSVMSILYAAGSRIPSGNSSPTPERCAAISSHHGMLSMKSCRIGSGIRCRFSQCRTDCSRFTNTAHGAVLPSDNRAVPRRWNSPAVDGVPNW